MANDLMSPEAAYEILTAQVHAPVFFNKLAADYNIHPRNADEARDMLELAGQLRNVHETENVKAASAKTSLVAQAKQDLQHVLGQYGYPTAANYEFKQAAVKAANIPLLKEAALVFKYAVENSN